MCVQSWHLDSLGSVFVCCLSSRGHRILRYTQRLQIFFIFWGSLIFGRNACCVHCVQALYPCAYPSQAPSWLCSLPNSRTCCRTPSMSTSCWRGWWPSWPVIPSPCSALSCSTPTWSSSPVSSPCCRCAMHACMGASRLCGGLGPRLKWPWVVWE